MFGKLCNQVCLDRHCKWTQLPVGCLEVTLAAIHLHRQNYVVVKLAASGEVATTAVQGGRYGFETGCDSFLYAMPAKQQLLPHSCLQLQQQGSHWGWPLCPTTINNNVTHNRRSVGQWTATAPIQIYCDISLGGSIVIHQPGNGNSDCDKWVSFRRTNCLWQRISLRQIIAWHGMMACCLAGPSQLSDTGRMALQLKDLVDAKLQCSILRLSIVRVFFAVKENKLLYCSLLIGHCSD